MTPSNQSEPTRDQYALKSKSVKKALTLPRLAYQPARPKRYRPTIGLVGCGAIVVEHLTAYRTAGYRVAALADPLLERARLRRDEFDLKADVYDNAEDLLARDDIDVVDLATHPSPRAALLEASIAAGKHVLSQKPFVLDLDFGQRICDAADRRSVKLAVNQNGRWAPHVSWMRLAIERGMIGDVSSVDTFVAWDHTWVEGTPFEKIPHLILYDFAIHWFDMLHCYTRGQRARTVFAQLARAPGQRVRPPLLAQISVQFDHALATLVFRGGNAPGPVDTTHITGAEGALRSEGPDIETQRVTLFTPKGQASPELAGTWFPGGFDGAMSELVVAIEEDRQPTNSGRDNLDSLAICFAAIESAETGQPAPVGSVRKVRDAWVREHA